MLQINTYGSFVEHRLIPFTIPEVPCGICGDQIPFAEQPILSCGHDNNCRTCLESWWAAEPLNDSKCPICREIRIFRNIGVEMEQANEVDIN